MRPPPWNAAASCRKWKSFGESSRWPLGWVLCTFRDGYVDAVIYFSALATDRKVAGFRFAKVSRERPVG